MNGKRNFFKVAVIKIGDCEECSERYHEVIIEADNFGDAEARAKAIDFGEAEFTVIMIELQMNDIILKND